jgi:hypothetical protein
VARGLGGIERRWEGSARVTLNNIARADRRGLSWGEHRLLSGNQAFDLIQKEIQQTRRSTGEQSDQHRAQVGEHGGPTQLRGA